MFSLLSFIIFSFFLPFLISFLISSIPSRLIAPSPTLLLFYYLGSLEIRIFLLDRWPYSAPSAALPNNSELTVPTSKTPPEQESMLETIMALTPTSHPGCP
jgi:hypothetical protein